MYGYHIVRERSHMESKIEYRDTPSREIKLPREVYYRCLWTVRDISRIREIACAAPGMPESDAEGGQIVSADVIRQAAADLKHISRSIEAVPEEYREGILDNIINREPFGDQAHPNTWKRWKLVFLHALAAELHLI